MTGVELVKARVATHVIRRALDRAHRAASVASRTARVAIDVDLRFIETEAEQLVGRELPLLCFSIRFLDRADETGLATASTGATTREMVRLIRLEILDAATTVAP